MKALYYDRSIPRGLAAQTLGRVRPSAALGPWSPVRYADVPEPQLPGPRWVKVRNRECGLCGTDVHQILMDVDPRTFAANIGAGSRKFLGHEAFGEVVEVGAEAGRPAAGDVSSPYGATPFAIGQRVALRIEWPSCYQMEIEPVCPQCRRGSYMLCERIGEKPLPKDTGGGFSPIMVCHRTQLFPVPARVPDSRTVLLEPTAVAVHAVLRRPAGPDSRVLVVGAGSIGLLVTAVLAALRPGAEVHCVARHSFQAERARRLGVHVHTGRAGLYKRLAQATGGRHTRGMLGTHLLLGGFELVIDTVGSASSITDSLRWTRAGGAVALVGAQVHMSRVDLTPVYMQEIEIVGVDSHAVEPDGRTSFDIAAELLADPAFPADGLVTHRIPVDQWQDAVRAFTDKRRSGATKVVLTHRW